MDFAKILRRVLVSRENFMSIRLQQKTPIKTDDKKFAKSKKS